MVMSVSQPYLMLRKTGINKVNFYALRYKGSLL